MQQKVCHKYVYKLHSSRLRKARWKLRLPLRNVLKTNDIISLNDSQVLRFIDELNGTNTDARAKEIREEILTARKKAPNKLPELYYELYKTRFQEDYVCIVMDRESDYDKLNKGFSINGIKYRRLLGTNGGVKNSTIIYVSERLYPEIKERLDCGRNPHALFVPPKLEAYQALICSGSVPVSMPRGIIVVPDCITCFTEEVIEIDDSSGEEPSLQKKIRDIELTESDGYGLALPSLMERWNQELGGVPGEVLSGANLRGLPWTKGMVFPMDYVQFGYEHDTFLIKDAWGDMRDVRDSELILTTSMLKLWDSYSSWEDYWENVQKYHYQIAIAKTAPHELEEVRSTNYQFLQSYHLPHEEIVELVQPTIDEIQDILGLDYRKTLLYLCGTHLKEENVKQLNSYVRALMIEPELINDPFVRSKVYNMIKKKIQQAKIGVIDVCGNFAIIGGDPYSLMQSMYGLPVTGLLKSGECYHKHWIDRNVDEICCFRAPMTSKYNIRKLRVVRNAEMDRWYQYIDTCMLLNSWDSTKEALNGADCDGDLFFTTNNPVLLRNTENLPAIFCIQRRAEKKLVTEEDLVRANKLAFGDSIGSTTNAITSQICVQARFEPDSEEYKILDYRIMCGQLYQQNAIDKVKGIVAKPMPKWWFDSKCLKVETDDPAEVVSQKAFNLSIVADKKPYFFIYNYPSLYKEYKDYVKFSDDSCYQEFGISLKQLLSIEAKTPEQETFVEFYYKMMPVNAETCIVNEICWIFEDAFDSIKEVRTEFNAEILKGDATYTPKEYTAIQQVYQDYCNQTKRFVIKNSKLSTSKKRQQNHQSAHALFKEVFEMDCYSVVPNEDVLCNILIDMCYTNNNSKQFVWDMCGDVIVQNLLKKHDYKLSYPVRDASGDIEFNGERFSMVTVDMREDDALSELY